MKIKYIYRRWNAQESVKLPHAFRDLPFDLTVDGQFSLFIVGAVGSSQINVSGVFFLPFSSSPFPGKKKKPPDRRLSDNEPNKHKQINITYTVKKFDSFNGCFRFHNQ